MVLCELSKELERQRQLVEETRQLREQLREAYGFAPTPIEVAPENWHQEADSRKLWKMFRAIAGN